MSKIFVILITFGLLYDIGNFLVGLCMYLRKRGHSTVPLVGFIFCTLGSIGLIQAGKIPWSQFWWLIIFFSGVHLTFQFILPILVTILTNLILSYDVFDMTPYWLKSKK